MMPLILSRPMKSPLRLSGILASLSLVLSVGLRAEMVVDDAGGYAVDMAAPHSRSQSEGKPTIYMLLHEEGAAAAYMVSYNDLPAGSGAKINKVDVMRAGMDSFLQSAAASLEKSAEHKLGDVSGLDFTFTGNKGGFSGHARFYILGDRFYQVVYMGPMNPAAAEKVLHYLDSFRLLH